MTPTSILRAPGLERVVDGCVCRWNWVGHAEADQKAKHGRESGGEFHVGV